MILDSSAVIAILAGEPDAAYYAQLIESDPTPRIGAPALLEASIVLTRWFGETAEAALDAFVRESGCEIVPFDFPQLRAAQEAQLRRLHELCAGAGLRRTIAVQGRGLWPDRHPSCRRRRMKFFRSLKGHDMGDIEPEKEPYRIADAAMYSMAREFGATFWTQDADYQGLAGVQYCARPR